MNNSKGPERYIALYLPWLIALLFKPNPAISYIVAWLGSFLIFYLTLTGWVKPLPDDRSFGDQLMRPLFIVQIIFAGYMCCTSIFYFLDVLGYVNFQKTDVFFMTDTGKLLLAAECQRYYCLGHAAFITGILVFMNYPKEHKYYSEKSELSSLILKIALISFPIALLFARVPGLSQFYYQINSLSFIAGTLALAFAIPLKKPVNTLISSLLYLFNFYEAFISGFKEPIITSILVLGIFLYPNYKKLVAVIFVPLLIASFILLPIYVGNFRKNAWGDNFGANESSQLALSATLNEESDSNWSFLAFRLSEISMFTTFVQSTPQTIDYYGTKLYEQSVIAIVPRAFWPTKPITEQMVMERVYAAGVVSRLSNVSAKPAFIVDAYLSGGAIGIFLSLFAYGAIAQLISIKAEKLFGGYILGTALIFSGLFHIFWRGLSFEFIINSVFWSYITMLIFHQILIATKVLKRVGQ